MIANSSKETAEQLLISQLSAVWCRLREVEAQRNKFVHKYRKVCKAYNWLCHVTNRRFKAGELDHLPAVVRQYNWRRGRMT